MGLHIHRAERTDLLADGLDDAGVLEFIRATTMVGVLPQPHAIVQRVYSPNVWTQCWFTTYLYSTVYLHTCKQLHMFDAGAIRLFQISVV